PDGRWLAATVFQGWARSEIFIKDRSKEDSKFEPLVEKIPAVFNVILRNDAFYVHTNHEAPRYRLFGVDPAKMAREQWQELLPQGRDKLEAVAVIGRTLVAETMHDASSQLQLYNLSGQRTHDIDMPTLGTIAGLGGEWDGNELYFGFQS